MGVVAKCTIVAFVARINDIATDASNYEKLIHNRHHRCRYLIRLRHNADEVVFGVRDGDRTVATLQTAHRDRVSL